MEDLVGITIFIFFIVFIAAAFFFGIWGEAPEGGGSDINEYKSNDEQVSIARVISQEKNVVLNRIGRSAIKISFYDLGLIIADSSNHAMHIAYDKIYDSRIANEEITMDPLPAKIAICSFYIALNLYFYKACTTIFEHDDAEKMYERIKNGIDFYSSGKDGINRKLPWKKDDLLKFQVESTYFLDTMLEEEREQGTFNMRLGKALFRRFVDYYEIDEEMISKDIICTFNELVVRLAGAKILRMNELIENTSHKIGF